tara:strand:+ start:56 stop:580 length:525 start_codon:yes stop_codon:yes gene_type:complete
MKTFKEFNIQSRESLTEALPALAVPPIVAGIGKGIGVALTADALRRTAQNLSKGKYKQAAFDAFSAIPAGRVAKVAKFLGAGKKIQNITKLGQNVNRHYMDNAYNKSISKLIDPKTYVDATKKVSPYVKKGINATKKTTSKIVNKTKETVKPLLKKDNLKKGVRVLHKAVRRMR